MTGGEDKLDLNYYYRCVTVRFKAIRFKSGLTYFVYSAVRIGTDDILYRFSLYAHMAIDNTSSIREPNNTRPR